MKDHKPWKNYAAFREAIEPELEIERRKLPEWEDVPTSSLGRDGIGKQAKRGRPFSKHHKET